MRLNKKVRVEVIQNLIKGVFGEQIATFETKTKKFILDEIELQLGDNRKWFESLTEEQQSFVKVEQRFVIGDHSGDYLRYLHPQLYCSYKIDNNTFIQIGSRSKSNYCSDIEKTVVAKKYPSKGYSLHSGADDMKTIISQQKALEATIKITIEQVYKGLLSFTSKKKAVEMMPDIEKYFPKPEVVTGTSLVPSELYNNINNLLKGVKK